MFVQSLTDDELVSNLEFCAAIMETDSSIDDIWIEYEDGVRMAYSDLLNEATRRAGGDIL